MTPTWIIQWMQTTTTSATPPEAVITVGWACNGEQVDNGKTYSASVYSTCTLPPADPASFIPYQDLTQQEVLNWIWANGVDKDSAEAAVAQQIQNQIDPPIVTPPLPWSQV
jgi:hypothetical protein